MARGSSSRARRGKKWGTLTDDDWQRAAGKRDQLVGRVQERYGIAKAEAEKQADEWAATVRVSERKSAAADRKR